VSNAAIEDFAGMLRAGSHLVIVGAQHELLMEQDRYRSQFWAAFDAFVPGTPLY
jgi:lysophospholipase